MALNILLLVNKKGLYMELPLNPTRKDIEEYKKYLANLPEDEWNIMCFKDIKVTFFVHILIIVCTLLLFYFTRHMITIPILLLTVFCTPFVVLEYFSIKKKIKKFNEVRENDNP